MGKNFKPYVGLRPFQADESLIFFGREKQTLELLQRLHYHNFVAVVGILFSGIAHGQSRFAVNHRTVITACQCF